MAPRLLAILSFLLGSIFAKAAPAWLAASVPDSPAVNQLQTDGNACGPACLLDAFRSGGAKWRASAAAIAGDSDAAQVKKIIYQFGKRGSRLDPKRARWNGRFGINGTDLADIANEMRTGSWMGTVKPEIFFKNARESEAALLKRVHQKLARSLKKGLPPIVRVRRVAFRAPQGSEVKSWLSVKSHYLVLTGLPAKLPRGATGFQVTYHDPWGGKKLRGIVRIAGPSEAGLSTVVADFPKSTVGRSLIKKGEASCLSLSSAIGLF